MDNVELLNKLNGFKEFANTTKETLNSKKEERLILQTNLKNLQDNLKKIESQCGALGIKPEELEVSINKGLEQLTIMQQNIMAIIPQDGSSLYNTCMPTNTTI